MVVSPLRRNTDETHHDGQLRRIGLLVDERGVPAHGSRQCRASAGLREVGVRLGVRNDDVESIAGGRQAGDAYVNHVDGEIRGVGSSDELVGWRLCVCALLSRPRRVIRSAIVLKPSTLLSLHRALISLR